MKAHTGDKLTISGHQVGEPQRIGRIEEVRGADGAPPYRVRRCCAPVASSRS